MRFILAELQEIIRDLLADAPTGTQPEVAIREVAGGGVCLAGAREIEVRFWPPWLPLVFSCRICDTRVVFFFSLSLVQRVNFNFRALRRILGCRPFLLAGAVRSDERFDWMGSSIRYEGRLDGRSASVCMA